ncbi:MAG TPA: ADYC domain-containing protein, partial [Kofleriaceae bacterium]|nr:ADYC domain-containing protein [Kofleriaceae bacterium]
AQASPLCGASSETASDRIPNNHAVLFEGERITAATKTVADDSRYWFNIGCAGTALAKLHLTGRTEAAQSVGFATDIDDRQAMLKMLVGDYCGTGRAFTVQGQPLMWRDDQGTIDMPTSPASELEAAWTADGAWCLSTPRLVKHPSAASAAKFPEGVEAAILAECGTRPRRCGEWLIVTPLRSYNPL